MNERIRQLAEQAGLYDFVIESMGIDKEMNKFAQLIVQECVTVMYDDAIKRKVPPDINQTPTHYAVAVLEHFGVEE